MVSIFVREWPPVYILRGGRMELKNSFARLFPKQLRTGRFQEKFEKSVAKSAIISILEAFFSKIVSKMIYTKCSFKSDF